MMNADDLCAFLTGQDLYAFDPATGDRVAQVAYDPDGTCRLRFADGRAEGGVYGFDGDTYWTRYDAFRGGAVNAFRLEPLAPGIAQAWHVDGTRAFIQTARDSLPPDLIAGPAD